LHRAISKYLTHYHKERNHQSLANRLIQSEPNHVINDGEIRRRLRLGGMLNYYYRAAA
jgi:hypothetical protein